MFLEGQVKLTLTDDLTGKIVDEITAKNVVTQASDEYLKFFMLGTPENNVSGPSLTQNRSPFDFLGGIMLFDQVIPDDAITRRGRGLSSMASHFVAGGNAVSGYVTTTKLRNVGNSVSKEWTRVGGAIEYNQTWTFGEYVSGIIRSLALTGNGITPYDNFGDCVLTDGGNNGRNKIFWIESSSTSGVWYAYSMYSHATGSGSSVYNVSIYKRRFYMPSITTPVITLTDRTLRWTSEPAEEIFSGQFSAQMIGSSYWPPVYEYTDGDNQVHFCSMFDNGMSGHDLHIVLSNGVVQVSEAAFERSSDYRVGHTPYDQFADYAYPFDIRNGNIYFISWYYPEQQPSTVYKRLIKADISADWNTISNPTVIKDLLPYGNGDTPRTTGLIRSSDDGLLILRATNDYNTIDAYVDSNDVVNPPLYFLHTGLNYTKASNSDTIFRINARSGYLVICGSYIGTICNLETPITKSSNRTLTVNYKLRAI